MKKDIVLSIVVGSVMAAGMMAPVSAAETTGHADKIESKAPASSGKCASGKCGTEKIYGQASLTHNPQDELVRARDGKCGLNGQGIQKDGAAQQAGDGKCVNGVCGV